MIRTVGQALDYVNRQIAGGRAFKPGMCKQETREAYNVPSDGAGDAAIAWRRTDHRFSGQWVRGAFIWWTGGSDGHGHVAICRWRKGRIATVDYPRVGHWNKTTVDQLEQAWPGLRFAGTSLDIDGVQVRRLPRLRRRWEHS